MLKDFLKSCRCVLRDEAADLEAVVHMIDRTFISFMPAVVPDIWPLYALECTAAKSYIPADRRSHVCFVPVCAKDDCGLHDFERLLNCFYADEDLDKYECGFFGAELEETILLDIGKYRSKLNIEGAGKADAVYARFEFPNGGACHLFIMACAPEECWTDVIEKYGISCDMLIESHKGFGDWFTNTPIYDLFCNTEKRSLLPKLYFKGRYTSINHEGFRRLYDVPESLPHDGVSAVYATPWNT